MHVTNFIYLTKRLMNAGFGQELNEVLKTRLQDQPTSFELPYKACFNRQILEITVYVKKWKEQDIHQLNMYYIHKYHASLSRENTVDQIGQDFYLGSYSPAVTIQEAYNLLCGRAVYKVNLINKEKVGFNAWVQLDFTQTDSKGNFKWHYYHDNYGYDLATELMKYPIPSLALPGATQYLISALQHGYREAITMSVDGREDRYFIEALPRFKSLVIYDDAENPLPRAEMAALSTTSQETTSLSAATSSSQEPDDDEGETEDLVLAPPPPAKKKRTYTK